MKRLLAKSLRLSLLFSVMLSVSATGSWLEADNGKGNQNLDVKLRGLLQLHGIHTPDAGPAHSPAKVDLGQALFFDRELSGNRDTSCATCHHPKLGTGDTLSLPIGTAPENPGAIGHNRIRGADRELIPRNAPEVFNRGSLLWTSQFWDSRVTEDAQGNLITPAGSALLPGLETVLSGQAMFPVTSPDEMRGRPGDQDVFGDINELALIDDQDVQAIWAALMIRVLAIDGYQQRFAAAYPGKNQSDLTFADAANAIAAYEATAFTMLDSPFDLYLQGIDSSLSDQQKRGAILFYGKAGCVSCHSGPLMTDQQHYNLAVPQLGPGKGDFAPRDPGRFLETLDQADLYAFRTPPLRNVAATGPWFHNGSHNDLRNVIRHHARPVKGLLSYRPTKNLDQTEVIPTVLDDFQTLFGLIMNLDGEKLPGNLSHNEVIQLESFLRSLTAPDLQQRLLNTIPQSVPSGLPIDGS